MRKNLYFIFFIGFVLFGFVSFAQVISQDEERGFSFREAFFGWRGFSSLAIFSGYDSNVYLSRKRQGSAFEEIIFSLNLSKEMDPAGLLKDFKFLLTYDLDFLNYNRFRKASNLLNHFSLALQKEISPFLLGLGSTLGIILYPHDTKGDFFFPKAFLFGRHYFNEDFYQGLRLEAGYKYYPHYKALGLSLSDYQDNDRHDYRYSGIYSIGASPLKNLFLKGEFKYTLNEANNLYLDFSDYQAYTGIFLLDYKLNQSFSFFSRFSYTHKDYQRQVTLGDYKQEDNLYSVSTGINYRLNRNQFLSTYYTYRRNSSNDYLAEYIEHVFSAGWRYNF